MRRVMLLVVSVLTIVTMTVSPAFAGDWDGDGWDDRDWWDHRADFYWYDVAYLGHGVTYDELCSPFLPEGIYVPGCIFSDPVEYDFLFVVDHDWDWDDHDWDRKDWDDHDHDCDDHDCDDDDHDWDDDDWEGPVPFID